MTDKNYTHLLVILDRSGSMATIKNDMVGSLNELFAEQAKLEGKCLVDFVQFDDRYEVAYTDREVSKARTVLQPRGMTALLDAVGKATVDFGKRLRDLPESQRPGLVQVVVVTDGYENSSREWTKEAVKDLIAEQESKYNWDYIFLGGDMDAVSVGTGFGFAGGKSLSYDTTNTGSMSFAANEYVTRSRNAVLAGQSVSSNVFTDDERDENS